MTETIIVALLSLAGTLGGSFCGILTANKLTNYRIEQLEKRVAEHNSLVDRMYRLEKAVAVDEEEIEHLKKYHE